MGGRTYGRATAVVAGIGTALALLAPTAGLSTTGAPTAASRGEPSSTGMEAHPAVTWTAPDPLPVTDARPEFRVDGTVIGYPELGADGKTLTLQTTEPVPAGGLQVWLGAQRLDQPGREPVAAGVTTLPADGAVTPAVDAGTPGAHPTETFRYSAPALPWREFDAPMEVLGQAVLPTDVSNAPLVLFLHGRHQPCFGKGDNGNWPCAGRSRPVPSHLGYTYLQELLASQGYATVSISANAINAQDFDSVDGGAAARSALVRRHLRLLAQRDGAVGSAFFDRLAMGRVVLVGHSRGGEGVNRAVADTGAGAPYQVRGQVDIAPTDFSGQTAGYVPTAVLLPYCDGDVFDLQGQQYVDRAVGLAADDTSLRSSLLIRGANHNFFNTEWTPGISQAPSSDDWFDRDHPLCGRKASPTRLTAAEQRRVGKGLVASAVRAFLERDPAMLAVLDSKSPVQLPSMGPKGLVWSHAVGGDRSLVRPGMGAQVQAPDVQCVANSGAGRPAPVRFCDADTRAARRLHWFQPVFGTYGPDTARELELDWTSPGETAALHLDEPWDLTGRKVNLRVMVDPAEGPAMLAVRLSDGTNTWTSRPVTLQPFRGGRGLNTLWAQTVRVDPPPSATLDRTQVSSVSVVAVGDDAHVWVVDAAARGATIPAVPHRVLPKLTLQNAGRVEGDSGSHTIEVPFRLSRPATEDTAFQLAVLGPNFRPRSFARTVTVPAGETAGTIAVAYRGDDLYDVRAERLFLAAVQVRGLTLAKQGAAARIRDDDPAPRLRVTTSQRSYAYGQPIRFRISLSEPVIGRLFVRVNERVPDEPLLPLRGFDVERPWLREMIFDRDPPLYTALSRLLRRTGWLGLGPARPQTTFAVPTVDRGQADRRSFTLVISTPGIAPDGVSRTVVVRPRR